MKKQELEELIDELNAISSWIQAYGSYLQAIGQTKYLSKEEKGWIKSAARSSTEKHEVIWDKAIKEAIKSAKEDMNVKFHDVDKSSFKKAVKPLQEEFKNNKGTEKQYKLIKEAEQNE